MYLNIKLFIASMEMKLVVELSYASRQFAKGR